jgi:hypothetical protein
VWVRGTKSDSASSMEGSARSICMKYKIVMMYHGLMKYWHLSDVAIMKEWTCLYGVVKEGASSPESYVSGHSGGTNLD